MCAADGTLCESVMFVDVVPIKRGCFVLDGVNILECFWSSTHSGKGRVFHHTRDLCLVDRGQALQSQRCHKILSLWLALTATELRYLI